MPEVPSRLSSRGGPLKPKRKKPSLTMKQWVAVASFAVLLAGASFFLPEPDDGGVGAPVTREDMVSALSLQQPGRAVRTSPLAINSLAGISLASLHETIQRPLFNQSRAPKAQAVMEQAPPEPQAGAQDFTLLAVVFAYDRSVVLLRVNQTNEIVRLKAGESFQNWRLAEVGPRSAVIESEGSRLPLELFATPAEASVPADQVAEQPNQTAAIGEAGDD